MKVEHKENLTPFGQKDIPVSGCHLGPSLFFEELWKKRHADDVTRRHSERVTGSFLALGRTGRKKKENHADKASSRAFVESQQKRRWTRDFNWAKKEKEIPWRNTLEKTSTSGMSGVRWGPFGYLTSREWVAFPKTLFVRGRLIFRRSQSENLFLRGQKDTV